MRTEFVLSEVAIGLRRNLTMTLASIVVVMVTLTLLGVALIVQHGTGRTKHNFLNQIEVSVYLDKACGTAGATSDCLSPDERTQVQQTLQQLPQVKQVTYVSEQEAYTRFKSLFAGEPALVQNVSPGELPESFQVQLRDPHQFAVVSSAVSQAPGVHKVDDASHDLKRLFSFFNRITVVVLVFGIILLVATTLLIYNAMRVAAFTRRRETGIMRLVGASDFSIQVPFVLEGTVIGVVGSILAVALLVGFREFVHSELKTPLLYAFGQWSTLDWSLPFVIIIGVVLPSLASFLTLQRHLRV
jgi:cell division transport system permease protein